MSNEEGYWTLGIQQNRRIGDKEYISLRIYIPTSDNPHLIEVLRNLGSQEGKLHFRRKFHGPNIILAPAQIRAKPPPSHPDMAQWADEIINFIAQQGGISAWPIVRKRFGLPPTSTPSSKLVELLEQRGLQRKKDPKTSTMIWTL
jgi:hypothetical protein